MLSRQADRQILDAQDHRGQGLEQLGDLLKEHRHEAEDQEEEAGQKSQEHHQHGGQARPAQALQQLHRALEQIGDHDARNHRREHPAEKDDRGEADQQQDREDRDLRVGEVAPEPVLDQPHGQAWARRPGRGKSKVKDRVAYCGLRRGR